MGVLTRSNPPPPHGGGGQEWFMAGIIFFFKHWSYLWIEIGVENWFLNSRIGFFFVFLSDASFNQFRFLFKAFKKFFFCYLLVSLSLSLSLDSI